MRFFNSALICQALERRMRGRRNIGYGLSSGDTMSCGRTAQVRNIQCCHRDLPRLKIRAMWQAEDRLSNRGIAPVWGSMETEDALKDFCDSVVGSSSRTNPSVPLKRRMGLLP